MLFMCDRREKLWPENWGTWTVILEAKNWDHAEKLAEEKNLVLVGQFLNWVCEDTGKKEYVI